MQNLLNLPTNPNELHKICYKIHPHSLHAFRFLTIGRELQEIRVNHPDFVHFAHSSRELRKICPHGQQSRGESSELQKNTANYTNSAPFAPTAGKLCEIHDICTQPKQESYVQFYTYLCTLLQHISYMYAHILAPSQSSITQLHFYYSNYILHCILHCILHVFYVCFI